jgi:hypothetical protein
MGLTDTGYGSIKGGKFIDQLRDEAARKRLRRGVCAITKF